jgi:predicted MFS family arabinose efflux permease
MVGKHALMNAIALNSTMFNTGRVLGPAMAGIALAVFGPAFCFGINAVSYLGVIVGLVMMRVAPTVRTATGSAVTRLREGLAYVRATPPIYRTIVLVGAVGIFGMNFNVWVPLLASDSFDSGASAYGLLFSAMGIGSLAGALSLAMFGRSPNRTQMLAATVALGVAEILLAAAAAVPTSIVIGMLFLAITGYASSTAMATANTLVQSTAGDALRGRVMAVYMTIFAGTAPFGALLSGAVADRFGVPAALAVGGIGTALAALAIGWSQRQRTPGPPVTVVARSS